MNEIIDEATILLQKMEQIMEPVIYLPKPPLEIIEDNLYLLDEESDDEYYVDSDDSASKEFKKDVGVQYSVGSFQSIKPDVLKTKPKIVAYFCAVVDQIVGNFDFSDHLVAYNLETNIRNCEPVKSENVMPASSVTKSLSNEINFTIPLVIVSPVCEEIFDKTSGTRYIVLLVNSAERGCICLQEFNATQLVNGWDNISKDLNDNPLHVLPFIDVESPRDPKIQVFGKWTCGSKKDVEAYASKFRKSAKEDAKVVSPCLPLISQEETLNQYEILKEEVPGINEIKDNSTKVSPDDDSEVDDEMVTDVSASIHFVAEEAKISSIDNDFAEDDVSEFSDAEMITDASMSNHNTRELMAVEVDDYIQSLSNSSNSEKSAHDDDFVVSPAPISFSARSDGFTNGFISYLDEEHTKSVVDRKGGLDIKEHIDSRTNEGQINNSVSSIPQLNVSDMDLSKEEETEEVEAEEEEEEEEEEEDNDSLLTSVESHLNHADIVASTKLKPSLPDNFSVSTGMNEVSFDEVYRKNSAELEKIEGEKEDLTEKVDIAVSSDTIDTMDLIDDEMIPVEAGEINASIENYSISTLSHAVIGDTDLETDPEKSRQEQELKEKLIEDIETEVVEAESHEIEQNFAEIISKKHEENQPISDVSLSASASLTNIISPLHDNAKSLDDLLNFWESPKKTLDVEEDTISVIENSVDVSKPLQSAPFKLTFLFSSIHIPSLVFEHFPTTFECSISFKVPFIESQLVCKRLIRLNENRHNQYPIEIGADVSIPIFSLNDKGLMDFFSKESSIVIKVVFSRASGKDLSYFCTYNLNSLAKVYNDLYNGDFEENLENSAGGILSLLFIDDIERDKTGYLTTRAFFDVKKSVPLEILSGEWTNIKLPQNEPSLPSNSFNNINSSKEVSSIPFTSDSNLFSPDFAKNSVISNTSYDSSLSDEEEQSFSSRRSSSRFALNEDSSFSENSSLFDNSTVSDHLLRLSSDLDKHDINQLKRRMFVLKKKFSKFIANNSKHDYDD
eukprot:TRINITY_DN1731_c0_g1_i1.p1 TRINITY_DN1731_c0_g1~~TRINITY_DN1731_c0_g1_i1.p1  ORF type:complete len:1014 (+),score=341.84 TRINITY_DN1731_c0_g1_i1:29-3070(+)